MQKIIDKKYGIYSKKYLLISPDFPPPNIGGSKVWLLNLVKNSGFEFDVLTCVKSPKFDEVLSGGKQSLQIKLCFQFLRTLKNSIN